MTPAETQLLSDAVKIGFPVLGTIAGTIIGGVSTYLLSKLGHKHDSKKELSKRRFDLLMQTANDVTEFEHLIGTYATEVSNKVQGLKGAVDFEEAKSNIYKNNQPLRRARMALKVLGLKEAEISLEKYIEITRELIRFGPNLSKERASELAKKIVLGPVEFYEALSKELSIV
ncbi:hypothetical protein H8K33_11790 [Undibacterium amnicola]|uniref:Uncharacterized protein n=1 Tax=Undibacterium amnicola TaxID=1834038 RepID=A0ABR6XRU5_9BURK|nr:hypothetical protein [Undibacterium amnicola]MBC3832196.1 hypothetical protein [Undibacterium amnicola]